MEQNPTEDELRAQVENLSAHNAKLTNELAEARQHCLFLHSILNSTNNEIFVKNDKHQWVYLNDASCKAKNETRENLLGKTDYDIHPPEQARIFWEKDDLVLTTGEQNLNQEEVTRKDGSTHVLSTSKSRFEDPDTGEKFVVGIIRDISERVALEEEREKLVAELYDAIAKIKTLRGLIPICANCKKVRDDTGYWKQVEVYIHEHSDAHFTHGMCPECSEQALSDAGIAHSEESAPDDAQHP